MDKKVEDYIKLQRKLFVLKYALFMNSNKTAYMACVFPKSTFF